MHSPSPGHSHLSDQHRQGFPPAARWTLSLVLLPLCLPDWCMMGRESNTLGLILYGSTLFAENSGRIRAQGPLNPSPFLFVLS
ncbi:hypothetical protein Ddc_09302 [Ditylenchus destructor]|nr:hypothetical protein Ddc_09302 [Ditylenchus destructor]